MGRDHQYPNYTESHLQVLICLSPAAAEIHLTPPPPYTSILTSELPYCPRDRGAGRGHCCGLGSFGCSEYPSVISVAKGINTPTNAGAVCVRWNKSSVLLRVGPADTVQKQAHLLGCWLWHDTLSFNSLHQVLFLKNTLNLYVCEKRAYNTYYFQSLKTSILNIYAKKSFFFPQAFYLIC